MPKIVIKEYDATSAGIGLYTNFTVLVPGFVAAGKGIDVFDENGVCELESQKDFMDKIGKISAEEGCSTTAVAPVIKTGYENITFTDDPEGEGAKTAKEKFIEYLAAVPATENLYQKIGWESTETPYIGYLANNSYHYELMEKDYDYEDDDEFDPNGDTFSIIAVGNEGRDREDGTQIGNQLAYELLGLGYSVLYKKIEANQLNSISTDPFWEPLKDKSIYDFRYVVNGLITGNENANKAIIKLADFVNSNPDNTGRGDCTALIDIDYNAYTENKAAKSQSEAIRGIQGELSKIPASKYAAIFAPYVVYGMTPDGIYNNSTFPGYFHYLACAIKASENYSEWYAVAGYTRGISNYSIVSTGCKFGEAAVQALEPRYTVGSVDKAVNLIIKVKNAYYLWGNRTAALLGTKDAEDGDLKASHFLNIRQLCTTIKKQVYISCRRFTFEPNSDTLWINFCDSIRPLLEKMKSDQGIMDYKFVKVATAQKGILKAKIRIVPIEAVEDFDISLTLEDSISGIVPGIDE